MYYKLSVIDHLYKHEATWYWPYNEPIRVKT